MKVYYKKFYGKTLNSDQQQ